MYHLYILKEKEFWSSSDSPVSRSTNIEVYSTCRSPVEVQLHIMQYLQLCSVRRVDNYAVVLHVDNRFPSSSFYA